ncbi:MAG TPA: iron-sulfur cluster repair di-iron protein [Terriglobales bacterium]|jgi:regulator of cell morphogenesis and NO signaling|nr:iron-sulfur cluster repair di-iron protein [Terriglobales bacterium]
MTIAVEKTVREMALEIPDATRVFEKLGIDYCCGGGKSLEEACSAAKLPIAQVLDALAKAGQPAVEPQHDWSSELLADLVEHIVHTHHKYTREEIGRLQALLVKVCSVHGKNHPELATIQGTFRGLSQELTMHMMKEEMVLFPYIVRMEEAVLEKEPVLPPPFGSVQNPVHMMMGEHDSAGEALRAMREASRGYAVPDDGCVSYRTLYQALEAFEADLHQHIHLENNVLFPRAVAMEESH